MPRMPKPKKEIWYADEDIHTKVKEPDPLRDEPENQKVLRAAHQFGNGVKMRVIWGVYGPGTEQKIESRYWWLLGENVTIVFRTVACANWFREQIKTWIDSMDGLQLLVEDSTDPEEKEQK